MFRTVPLSIIRNFSLYTHQWYMSYRFADSLLAGTGRNWFGSAAGGVSCSQAVSILVWHIPLLCVQWEIPDDGQRNCPKHVEFYSKNKFEKLVHLVGFIIRIYHDARSPECQKQGYLLSVQCRVTFDSADRYTSYNVDLKSPRHFMMFYVGFRTHLLFSGCFDLGSFRDLPVNWSRPDLEITAIIWTAQL